MSKHVNEKDNRGKKASLVEVLEQDFFDNRERVVQCLETAADLKIEIEQRTTKLDELKEELAAATAEHGLEGLRHNKIAFILRLNPGRMSVDIDKFKQALVASGVQADVIKSCQDGATKQGESYWVREISLLK